MEEFKIRIRKCIRFFDCIINYSTYFMYMKYLDGEVGLTTVCYQDLYRNQTWGSCRKGYVEPVVTIPISIIGEKTNGIWKLN